MIVLSDDFLSVQKFCRASNAILAKEAQQALIREISPGLWAVKSKSRDVIVGFVKSENHKIFFAVAKDEQPDEWLTEANLNFTKAVYKIFKLLPIVVFKGIEFTA